MHGLQKPLATVDTMKERVRDSSGLPLRAMVMVLLFLGVIFLLVGMQAVGNQGDDEGSGTSIVNTNTSTTSKKPPAPAKADVVVINTSDDEAAGTGAADKLKKGGYNVTDTRKADLTGVTETTVFYGDAAGEREAAEEVGKLMDAPVEPRGAGLADEPPGIIVAVTG